MKDNLKEALDNPVFLYVDTGKFWSPHEGNGGGFTLNWRAKDIGFGEIAFYVDKESNKVICDTECMGDDFVRKALEHWLSNEVEFK